MFESINRSLLTREQRETLETFERGFNSPFWSLLRERFEALADADRDAFDSVMGDQALGVIQGRRQISRAVARYDEVVEREILSLIEDAQALEPEGPEFDDAWHD